MTHVSHLGRILSIVGAVTLVTWAALLLIGISYDVRHWLAAIRKRRQRIAEARRVRVQPGVSARVLHAIEPRPTLYDWQREQRAEIQIALLDRMINHVYTGPEND